jgi:hypothetical protein
MGRRALSKLYHCHHLCKYLVQAVKPLPASFSNSIFRKRTTPIYHHPHLVWIGEDGQPMDSPAFHNPDNGEYHRLQVTMLGWAAWATKMCWKVMEVGEIRLRRECGVANILERARLRDRFCTRCTAHEVNWAAFTIRIIRWATKTYQVRSTNTVP